MSETKAAAYPSSPMQWLTVSVLFLLYILSFTDRYIIALLVEPIKADLGLSDFQISLLQGPAFALLYCLCAIPVGLLLDRYSRRWVLYFSITVWSLGAAGCGLASGFIALFVARALVGAGESGFSTGAYSIIGDSFQPEKVSLAMSVFVMGGVMGAGIVFLLGGPLVGAVLKGGAAVWPLVGEVQPWQQVFIITGLPGVVMAFLVFLFREPQRRGTAAAGNRGYGEALRFVWANGRQFAAIFLGFSLVYTVTVAFQQWTPAYLIRAHGWEPARIGVLLGIAQIIGALSLPIHGAIVDRLYKSGRKDAPLLWCLITLVIAAPFGVAAYLVDDGMATVILFGCYFTIIMSTSSMGPAATQLVTPPELRGRVSALYVVVTGLVAMSVGGSLVGLLTDYVLRDPARLGTAMVIVAVTILSIAALLFARGRAALHATLTASDATR